MGRQAQDKDTTWREEQTTPPGAPHPVPKRFENPRPFLAEVPASNYPFAFGKKHPEKTVEWVVINDPVYVEWILTKAAFVPMALRRRLENAMSWAYSWEPPEGSKRL